VVYEDGFKEDYPETRDLPALGDVVDTTEKVIENEELVAKSVPRKVARIVTWEERRQTMKGSCLNCHNNTYVDNFYKQFDDFVVLYNEKFARPAKQFMDDLTQDGVLNKNAPFEHHVQWIFWELWHHEGRRGRHGASMMGPDYTHWHGLYEVAKHYYDKFLPAVVEAARTKGLAMARKYERKVEEHLAREEHVWLRGLSPEEVERLRRMYRDRYNEYQGTL
jgi:hypothetical protein